MWNRLHLNVCLSVFHYSLKVMLRIQYTLKLTNSRWFYLFRWKCSYSFLAKNGKAVCSTYLPPIISELLRSRNNKTLHFFLFRNNECAVCLRSRRVGSCLFCTTINSVVMELRTNGKMITNWHIDAAASINLCCACKDNSVTASKLTNFKKSYFATAVTILSAQNI